MKRRTKHDSFLKMYERIPFIAHLQQPHAQIACGEPPHCFMLTYCRCSYPLDEALECVLMASRSTAVFRKSSEYFIRILSPRLLHSHAWSTYHRSPYCPVEALCVLASRSMAVFRKSSECSLCPMQYKPTSTACSNNIRRDPHCLMNGQPIVVVRREHSRVFDGFTKHFI